MEQEKAIEFIASIRGENKIKYKGFLYERDSEYKEKSYWKCDKYKKLKCRARITVMKDKVVKIKDNHNHEGSPLEVQKKIVMNDIKNLARTKTNASTSQVLAESLSKVSEGVLQIRPKKNSIKKTIRRARGEQRCDSVPLCDFIVPEEFQVTAEGDRFLLFDSGNNSDRILIFSTNKNFRTLSKCNCKRRNLRSIINRVERV